MTSVKATQLVFPIVVWSERYIKTFLELALPTFLAPDNLPFCAKTLPTRLVIMTTAESAEQILRSSEIRYAKEVCDVEIRPAVTPDLLSQHNKYGVMASLHHEVIKSLQTTDALVGILSPDCVLSQGCLKAALLRILSGYHAVLVAGPRASLQYFDKNIARNGDRKSPYIELQSRRLVAALTENFHPISASVVFSAKKFSIMPSCLYWKASQKTFVARYFHLHPLLVTVSPEMQFSDQHTGTVDSTLLEDTGVSKRKYYVCEDSDEMAVVELSDMGAMDMPTKKRLFKSLFIYRWSRQWASSSHIRNFLSHTFLFKGDDTDLSDTLAHAEKDTRSLRLLFRIFAR